MTGEKEIHMIPIQTQVKPQPSVVKPVVKIKKHSRNQVIWLSDAVITSAAGGYFKYSADQKYNEYLGSTNSEEADDLQKTVKLYDTLTPAFFGLAGICSVGFTIQTVKKSKIKNNRLAMSLNGHGVQLTYNF